MKKTWNGKGIIMTFVSYAQNLEDVMLWRALKHIEKGFYVDVGANDPVNLSLTNAFYQRGWNGINIDPVTYEDLCRERERDINLAVVASSAEKDITFYEVGDSALSTSDFNLIKKYRETGQTIIERTVKALTLNQILKKHTNQSNQPIHFMNIDVEGAELEVLQGLDLSVWRPWILLVEATVPTTRTLAYEKWEPTILSSNYKFIYFDGLNRFYLAKEHLELEEAFRLPPNIFDHYILANQHDIQEELKTKENFIQMQVKEMSAKEDFIQVQAKELQEKENLIQSQISELEAKERVIQVFRKIPFLVFFSQIVLKIIDRLRNIRLRFRPKVGVLEQFSPRPLSIPKRYLNSSAIASSDTISIITPSYNQGEFIERTVRSVLEQEYSNLEYIIQDGNSNDNTLDILNSFIPDLKYFETREDNGQAHAINLGFQHATGEIMAFLNADDLFLPGTLSFVSDYFSRHPDIDVVYGHRVIINEHDQEIGRWVLPPHDNEIILWADYIPQETLFWRRSLWEKAGGKMDETFRFALDWDLILRFREAGAKFKRLPRFLGAFRLHSQQKTSMQINSVGLDEMNRLRKRMHQREVSEQEVYKNIKPYLRRSVFYHKLYRLGLFRY